MGHCVCVRVCWCVCTSESLIRPCMCLRAYVVVVLGGEVGGSRLERQKQLLLERGH